MATISKHLNVTLPLVLLGLLGCGLAEIRESKFEDFAELQSSGLMIRGWIPDNFPESAREIFEAHDLDTNRVWIRFIVGSESELSEFQSGSQMVALDDFSFSRPPITVRWWPKDDQLRVSRSARLIKDDDLNSCLLWSAAPKNTYYLFCSRQDLELLVSKSGVKDDCGDVIPAGTPLCQVG